MYVCVCTCVEKLRAGPPHCLSIHAASRRMCPNVSREHSVNVCAHVLRTKCEMQSGMSVVTRIYFMD